MSYVVVILAYYGVAITGYAAFGAAVSSGAARLGAPRAFPPARCRLLLMAVAPTLTSTLPSPAPAPAPAPCLAPSADVLLSIKEPAAVVSAAHLFVVLHVAAAWQVGQGCCSVGGHC